MRVLFVAPELPWPRISGNQQRTYALLKAIASRHEVILSTPVDEHEGDVAERVSHLADLIQDFIPVSREQSRSLHIPKDGSRINRFREYFVDLTRTRVPYHFRQRSDAWRAALEQVLPTCDVVFCRYLVCHPAIASFPPERVILDADDLHYRMQWQEARLGYRGWGSLFSALESARMYAHEQAWFKKVAWTLVCSEDDLQRLGTPRKSVLRNGINLHQTTPAQATPDANTLMMLGWMTYDPNLLGLKWFLQHVWPRLRELNPDVKLNVVGRQADAETLPFAVNVPGVALIGQVPEVTPWIMRATCSIVPLHQGMGTRIKILESLGCGRPVISTHLGADGLEMFNESNGITRCDDPATMAAKIHETLKNPTLALARAAQGRQIIEQQFSWDALTANLATDIETRFLPAQLV